MGFIRSSVALALLAASSVVEVAKARIGLGAVELTSKTFDKFVADNERVMIDFYNSSDPMWPTFNKELEDAAREARDYGCTVPIGKINAHVEADLVRRIIANRHFPTLVWFHHGLSTQYQRTLRKSKMIVDFILALDRDPIQFGKSEAEIRESVNRALWGSFPKSSPMFKAFQVVASKHMDTLEVAYQEGEGMDVKWLEDGKDSSAEDMHFRGNETVEALDKWVRGFLTRSEPLPEPRPGDSLQVVGKTFEEMVIRPDKDVFLLIYVPWCGFCRIFLPTWENFARRVADVDHLAVMKMDGERNGSPVPEFHWTAYPVVFYLRAGTREPLVFHGNRTIARLLNFARQHGTGRIPEDLDIVTDTTHTARETLLSQADWEL